MAVVVPGMSPLEITVATEFLGVDRPELGGPRWYRFTICAPEPGPVALEGGMSLYVDRGLGALRRADTVVVPGWAGGGHAVQPEVITALTAAAGGGAHGVVLHRGLRPGRGRRARRSTVPPPTGPQPTTWRSASRR